MTSALLDPLIIAQLGNLKLRARRILDGIYSGQHINLARGQSKDFSEHRPYNPGDDLRSLDWKVFGRTDRLVVKQYEEQTNIGAVAIIDDSASMNFSWDGRPSKLEYAKTLAAALGYLVIGQQDAIAMVSSRVNVPLGSQRGHIERYFEALDGLTGLGTWDLDTIAQSVGVLVKKKTFVLVFSDLMASAEKVITTLRSLQSRKYEVLVFHLLDPAERDLPFNGPILFEDSETGEKLKTEPDSIRAAYREMVEEKIANFSHVFGSSGIDYVHITTNTSFDKGLGAYLSYRAARL